ncbi:MAG: hypothetical protein LBG05_03540 [Treponema sp.]|nr:hypothetical protein [Treponema sp.]
MKTEDDTCFGCLRNCPTRLNVDKAPTRILLKQAFNALISPILGFCSGFLVCRLFFPDASVDISLTFSVICFFAGAVVRFLATQIPRRLS